MDLSGPNYTAPSRDTTAPELHDTKHNETSQIESILNAQTRKLSISKDSWSSRVHCWYVVVNISRNNENLKLYSILLDFARFCALHAGDVYAAQLFNTFEKRDFFAKTKSVISYNSSDICARMVILYENITAKVMTVDFFETFICVVRHILSTLL